VRSLSGLSGATPRAMPRFSRLRRGHFLSSWLTWALGTRPDQCLRGRQRHVRRLRGDGDHLVALPLIVAAGVALRLVTFRRSSHRR
jgi:hypothetical protein